MMYYSEDLFWGVFMPMLVSALLVFPGTLIIPFIVASLYLVIIKAFRSSLRQQLSWISVCIWGIVTTVAIVAAFLAYSTLANENLAALSARRGELEHQFINIMQSGDISRCAEFSSIHKELMEINRKLSGTEYYGMSPRASFKRYLLYSEEACRRMMEGDYAHFASQSFSLDTWDPPTAPANVFSPMLIAWKVIFDLHGYDHCRAAAQSLHNFPTKQQADFLQKFCALEQAVATRDPRYCVALPGDGGKDERMGKVRVGISPFEYSSCMDGVALLSKDEKVCDALQDALLAKQRAEDVEERDVALLLSSCRDSLRMDMLVGPERELLYGKFGDSYSSLRNRKEEGERR